MSHDHEKDIEEDIEQDAETGRERIEDHLTFEEAGIICAKVDHACDIMYFVGRTSGWPRGRSKCSADVLYPMVADCVERDDIHRVEFGPYVVEYRPPDDEETGLCLDIMVVLV